MRPGSIDEVIAAYTQAIRERNTLRDHLRVAVEQVRKIEHGIAEKTTIVRELRDEVRNYGIESGEHGTKTKARAEVAA